MDNKGSKYYYSRLSYGEKNVYNKLCDALLNFEPAISMHAGMGKPFEIDIEEVIAAVIFDNPVFFYVNRERIMIRQSPMYIQVVFNYDYRRDEAERLWAQVQQKIESFVAAKIKPEMSPLAKQLEIHRYVTAIKGAKPPYDKDCFSAIGAFINNNCVCEGYSKAYKLLCDRVGIASIIVLGDGVAPDGTSERHAWNITRINGVTAHTDATWNARYGVSNYDYFNLTDAEISADHRFEKGKYPQCLPNKINYFYKNGLIASNKSELEAIVKAKQKADRYSVKLLFKLDYEAVKDLPFGNGKIAFNEALNILSYFTK